MHPAKAAAALASKRLRTLVLNADYSPLSACHPVRGALLLRENKAHEVESTDILLFSEKLSLRAPAVIVLTQYQSIGKPRRTGNSTRPRILQRDAYVCQYCGGVARTVDHVIPKSDGGRDTWTNMVACCAKCNARKGALSLKQSGMRLLREPLEPRPADMMRQKLSAYRLRPHSAVASAWEKYL